MGSHSSKEALEKVNLPRQINCVCCYSQFSVPQTDGCDGALGETNRVESPIESDASETNEIDGLDKTIQDEDSACL